MLCTAVVAEEADGSGIEPLPGYDVVETRLEKRKERAETRRGYRAVTTARYVHAIGLAMGHSAVGLSYRFNFARRYGIQVSVLPIFFKRDYGADTLYDEWYSVTDYRYYQFLDVGLIVNRNVEMYKFADFRWYLGTNVTYRKDEWGGYERRSEYDEYNDEYVYSHVYRETVERSRHVSLSGGMGVEYFVWKFSLTGMAGLIGEIDIDNGLDSFGPALDFGLHFRFKKRE
jgi:hypothetical protein